MSIWLIGNRGLAGAEVEEPLNRDGLPHCCTDSEVDILDIEALRHFVSHRQGTIDWIVNCSGYTAVDKAEIEPESAYGVNVQGVHNIATVSKELDSTLIHISTDCVFDGGKETAYVEEDLTAPQGTYADSKLKGEGYVRSELKRYYIIRTSWPYGKHGPNFVQTMLRLFRQKDKDIVRVVADQWGSPTFARDLANTIMAVVQAQGKKYGVYHFTNEGKTNWCEFACEIYNQALDRGLIGKKVRIMPITTEEYPTRAKRPRNSYLSKERIKYVFGIPILKWQDALPEYLYSLEA